MGLGFPVLTIPLSGKIVSPKGILGGLTGGPFDVVFNSCALPAPSPSLTASGRFLPLLIAYPHGRGNDWWICNCWSFGPEDALETFASIETAEHARYVLPPCAAYGWWRTPTVLRLLRFSWSRLAMTALWSLLGTPLPDTPAHTIASMLLPTRTLTGSLRWIPERRCLQTWLKLEP